MINQFLSRRKIGFFFLISFLILALFAGWTALAQQNGEKAPKTVSLILSGGVERVGYDQIAPQAKRYREVKINELVLTPGAVAPGDRIVITPFANEFYVAVIDRASVDVNKTLSLRGRLEGMEDGYMLLSSSMGRVLASISVPDGNKKYRIIYNPAAKTHFIQEVAAEKRDELPDSPSPIPPLNGQEKGNEIPPQGATNVTIDVMIVYTPAAKSWADANSGGINALINQDVQLGQLALDNSSTGITIRLVQSAQVTYTESGDSFVDLCRLTNADSNGYIIAPDGYMDEVQGWRDTYGADVVALYAYVEDTGGIGWLLNTTAGLPNHAYSLSRVQQVGWSLTSIHEIGHNMGCGHRKDQAVQPGPGLFSYSAGWHWTGTDNGLYCSVMSYEDGGYTRVSHFSNPSITHAGVATGDAVDGDNARGLREIKSVIAAYRTSVTSTIKNDFNKDGEEDILWRYYGPGGKNVVWYMQGATHTGSASLLTVTDLLWQIVGTGDFDGDGWPDILWRSYGSGGKNGVWYMQGATRLASAYLTAVTDLNWQIVGTGDFNRDGWPDILWRYDGSGGKNVVWYMQGATRTASVYLPAVTDLNWEIAGTGDFNRDGWPDILWRYNGSGGKNVVWYMQGATRTGTVSLGAVTDLNWKIGGAGDFNGDGWPDILWRYKGSGGKNLVWYMQGATRTGTASLGAVTDLHWKIENH
jgi:hypothetical protein